ncbi:gonadotropin-releasing hormone II receptor-like [Ctenocephalides felis]|uniref:gonadotropin-releasing hormone II receptor-like n=1 Tax=Ctenocephalides felis TaxID=7515 RepID=UPI000E6E37CA|nr:gonadotropin-releasing hormone II receptor-like [Ctenocephalides felis]
MEDNYTSSLAFDVKMGNMTMEDCDLLQYNGTYNETIHGVLCLEHAPTLTHSGMIRVWVLTGMALLSLFGNAATIFSIRRSRSRRLARHSWSAVYTLILHLSIADLLVTIFCIAGEAAWSYTVQWYAGNLACKLYKFVQVFSLYLSTFVLVLIGVDRFLAVRYPMQSLSTMRRCQRLLIAAWLLSFILSTPQDEVFVKNKLRAYIPTFLLIRKGVIHGIDADMTDQEIREDIKSDVEISDLKE